MFPLIKFLFLLIWPCCYFPSRIYSAIIFFFFTFILIAAKYIRIFRFFITIAIIVMIILITSWVLIPSKSSLWWLLIFPSKIVNSIVSYFYIFLLFTLNDDCKSYLIWSKDVFIQINYVPFLLPLNLLISL